MFEQFYTMQTYPLKPVVAEAEVTVVSDTDLHEVVKKIKIKKKTEYSRLQILQILEADREVNQPLSR